MDEAKQVSTLIGDIDDAALDRALWPAVLERTCGYIRGQNAAVLMQGPTQSSAEFFFEWGTDPHYLKLHRETYVKLSPVLVPTLLCAKVGDVLSIGDLIPYGEFLASRFYKEWAAPQGIVDAISVTLDKSATTYAVAAVSRHGRDGPVDFEMRRRITLLAPHFRRGVHIGKVIDLHKVEAAALADSLDGLAAAMFLVDTGGRIVHANARGLAMLAEGSVVHGAAGGKLAAIDPQAERALHDVFMNAAGGDAAVGTRGIAVSMTARNGERYVAHVLPLTSGARRKAGITYSAVAAVFVRKAALDLLHPLEILANAFKLTPAELRVLIAIVQIGGVPEIAPVLGISETTVKTHLQRESEKTGANRQADLVKRVAGYMSPLAG